MFYFIVLFIFLILVLYFKNIYREDSLRRFLKNAETNIEDILVTKTDTGFCLRLNDEILTLQIVDNERYQGESSSNGIGKLSFQSKNKIFRIKNPNKYNDSINEILIHYYYLT